MDSAKKVTLNPQPYDLVLPAPHAYATVLIEAALTWLKFFVQQFTFVLRET